MLAGVLGITSLAIAAGLKPADTGRLERARNIRQTEIAKASERYKTALTDANQKLSVVYNSVIAQYEKAGDADTAATLKKELEDLLAAPIETPKASANYNQQLIQMIGPSLVLADGKQVRTADLGDVEHVLLYFSASWCGPCKKFTPSLVEFFEQNAESRKVMVILVGRDNSEAEMLKYMSEHGMKWPAIPFKQIERSGVLAKYGGRGIPNLVLLNTDGTVRSGSYVGENYVGPNKVLADLKTILAADEK